MYLTYAEYKNMGGTLDEPSFDGYEFEAESIVNWYTFNRLAKDTQIPDAVKKVVKYLIDLIQHQNDLLSGSQSGDNASGKIIASQSNDGVSVSYSVLSASELLETIKSSEENTIRRYLQDVVNEAGRKLLYRGLYPGE